MEWIVNNWFIVLGFMCVGGVIGIEIYKFVNKPTPEQLKKVKEWLIYAVSIAEKELGSNTGALKLRQVYEMFVLTFPTIANLISFEMFSGLVDEALEQMRKMLEENKAVRSFIEGD